MDNEDTETVPTAPVENTALSRLASGASASFGKLHLQTLGGNGKTAVGAVDEMQVPLLGQVEDHARHQRAPGGVQAIADRAGVVHPVEQGCDGVKLLLAAVQHQAQRAVEAAVVGVLAQFSAVDRGVVIPGRQVEAF